MAQLDDIYANVEDLSGKRTSICKSSENVLINTLKPGRNGPSPSGVGDVKKSSFKAVAVILGLLSFFLLTGFITSVCLFTKGISQREMEMIQLQTSNANLTNEIEQLQTSYTILSKERDHLMKQVQNLDSLTTTHANVKSHMRWFGHSGIRKRIRRDGNGWMQLR
ncbi:uncharacterized protein AB9W97_015095 isoform 1-T3 [Spinachia spinachia]